MGRAGSGKGTQAEELKKYLEYKDQREVYHLESGQRFRDFIKEDSYASRLSNELNTLGKLQPEFLAVWAWVGELVRNLKENLHLIVDGTPRRLKEAEIFTNAMKFYKRPPISVVYLKVSDENSIERMKERGRADDKSIETIKERLSWFDRDVLPVIEYFKENPDIYTVYEIDGEKSIEDVHNDIVSKLGI